MSSIEGFHSEYRFLSNFYRHMDPIMEEHSQGVLSCPVTLAYRTAEHAYQAAKYTNLDHKIEVADAKTPGDAKVVGRRYKARLDWDAIKLDVMLQVVRQKFYQPQLRQLLLSTGNAVLVEVNHHGDHFWGTDEFLDGENHLGRILMQVRDELQNVPHQSPQQLDI